MKATILQSTGSWYKIKTDDGEILQARLRGKMRLQDLDVTNPVAVGDRVSVQFDDQSTASITGVEERRNLILRKATRKTKDARNQIIAANIDAAVAMQAVAQPNPKPGFFDRFLVTCEAYDVPPALLFNKTDLLGKKSSEKTLNELTEIYRSLDYPVYHTSVKDPESVRLFSEFIKDKLVVLIGHSGVGKSTLINTIDPGINLKTADVSKASEKGKHTTTFAQLHQLSNGAKLVDTPGIREFGLVNIYRKELSLYFREMSQAREECKFYDCTHVHEPGCSVIEQVNEGKIARQRYQSYLNILDSLKE